MVMQVDQIWAMRRREIEVVVLQFVPGGCSGRTEQGTEIDSAAAEPSMHCLKRPGLFSSSSMIFITVRDRD